MNPMQMLSNMMGGNGGFNPMQLLQMMQGGQMNPQQLMGMFGNNPQFQQAVKMMQGGGNPTDIIKNVASQKGIDMGQLQQMAQQFGIKL